MMDITCFTSSSGEALISFRTGKASASKEESWALQRISARRHLSNHGEIVSSQLLQPHDAPACLQNRQRGGTHPVDSEPWRSPAAGAAERRRRLPSRFELPRAVRGGVVLGGPHGRRSTEPGGGETVTGPTVSPARRVPFASTQRAASSDGSPTPSDAATGQELQRLAGLSCEIGGFSGRRGASWVSGPTVMSPRSLQHRGRPRRAPSSRRDRAIREHAW